MKYIKYFNDHINYSNFISSFEYKSLLRDVVSYCKTQNEVHYDKYHPIYNLLDILYSDSNGNKKVDSDVLDPSLGYTPIGLCVIPTGFFGDNEKARFMSLKYMDYANPDNGSLNVVGMAFGNIRVDISTISNIQTTNLGGSSSGYIAELNSDNNTPEIPNLLNSNNEWNLSELGAINTYAMTDINGKNKTELILATATSQSTWRTDSTISNENGSGYAPAACCCWRYHTLGTQQGDWYLGGCGEYSLMLINRQNILSKLQLLSSSYPNDCISSIVSNRYWTSTEYNDLYTYVYYTSGNITGEYNKNYGANLIALLQY